MSPNDFEDNIMFNAEINALKKSWYAHVLTTLEKLGDNLDRLSNELYKQRDEFRKDLYDLREKIRKETADAHSLEVLEKHIEDVLKRVEKRIEDIEKSVDAGSLATEIVKIRSDLRDLDNKIKNDIRDQFDTYREKNLDPIIIRLNRVEVKVALYGVIAGAMGAGATTFVLWLLKISVSN